MLPDRAKVTLYLPAELHRRLRLRAVEESRSMSEVVEGAVERLLAEPARPAPWAPPGRRVRPGLRPGTAARVLADRERLRASAGTFSVAEEIEELRETRSAEISQGLPPEPGRAAAS